MSGITYNVGDLEELRTRVGSWADKNFPVPDGDTNKQLRWMLRECCGMSEELAALVVASDDDINDEVLDAVADIAIYSLSFMWHASFRVQEVLLFDKEPCRFESSWMYVKQDFRSFRIDCLIVGLAYHIGRLSHHVLKTDQNIRKHENHWEQMRLHVCHIWRLLYRLTSGHYSRDLSGLVVEVGERVLDRDWIEYPDTAHENK